MPGKTKPDGSGIAYAHPTHAEFNKRFEPKTGKSRDVHAPYRPWKRVPAMHQEFDKSRDVFLARQMNDQGKSEAQRRSESVAYAAKRATKNSMVAKDKPNLNLRPPEHIARPVDRAHFRGRWLAAQHEAAMEAAAPDQSRHQARSLARAHPSLKGPSR